MNYRSFGRTGLRISEVGFGAWAIGSTSYGTVDRKEALNALARAEELGCNFVDTASVYGDSESILAEFTRGRRDRWLIATKYSNPQQGLTRTAEEQLRRLNIETIDFYQIHWAPSRRQRHLYEELYQLKKSGKARTVGVSLHTGGDIVEALAQEVLDGLQLRISLLDPDPYLNALPSIRARNIGIIARSCLKEGFLTGKYHRESAFPDNRDQRSAWSRERIARIIEQVERFRFLEQENNSLLLSAARYPLSFQETSTVLMGTKSIPHADVNFGIVPNAPLSPLTLERILATQHELHLIPSFFRIAVRALKRTLQL